jgi:radical SAM superfamily enzyme YgiQ (UPF0313 family)
LRRTILKKNITDEQIRQAAYLFRKYDIRMKTFNIMGLPDETVGKALKTIRINADIKVDYPWCSILQPYPRTELAAIAKDKGLLQDDFSLDHLEASFFSGSVLKQDNIKELVRLQKLFYLGVKLPWTQRLLPRLVKFPLDRLYHLLFALSFTWRFMQETDIGFWNALKFAYRHRKNL